MKETKDYFCTYIRGKRGFVSKRKRRNKLMVLFLPMLVWSFSGPLDRSVGYDRRTTCNLQKRGDPARVCRPPLRWLSQFLSYEKERIRLYFFFNGVIDAYLFVVEWVGIYKGKK